MQRAIADGADREARGDDPRGWTRRRVLRAALAGAGALLASDWIAPRVVRAEPATDASLPPELRERLGASRFLYVSPLRRDGGESRCHGEVWYAWLDDSVVIITSRTSWKGRALAQGLDRARIWVGDYGRWKGWLRNNEAFREAPSFRARARIVNDPALLQRLMDRYAEKYPEEFPGWEDRMRGGFASGERILIRYRPDVGAADPPATSRGDAGASEVASAGTADAGSLPTSTYQR